MSLIAPDDPDTLTPATVPAVDAPLTRANDPDTLAPATVPAGDAPSMRADDPDTLAPATVRADELPPPASVDQPTAQPLPSVRWLPWAVLVITLLGGIFRFATIYRPPLWGDEGATYWRICGTFRQLLDILQADGFAPLHYELYWLLHNLPVSAATINWLLPSLFAVLTFSAVYVTARRIAGPLTAFLLGWLARAAAGVAAHILGHAHALHPTQEWAWLAAGILSLPTAYIFSRAFVSRSASVAAALITGATVGVIIYALTCVIWLTPPVMRFVPALAGTLMIPAMYFLASQIVSRKTSLLVAVFTACSAYLMVYSHDAKMYMHLWLFGVLSVACLLRWLGGREEGEEGKEGRRVGGQENRTKLPLAPSLPPSYAPALLPSCPPSLLPWLAWIATSICCVGIHTPGWMVLGIQPLILLTHRRLSWRRVAPFLVGMMLIASASLGHYLGFNKWAENIEDRGWGSSGISWVEDYDQGGTGPDLLLYTTTAHLYSWEWPAEKTFGPTEPWVFKTMASCGVVLLLLLAAGALPWKRGVRTTGSSTLDASPQPWWRSLLWIGIWLVLPAYGFYCWSMAEYASPLGWFTAVSDLFTHAAPLDTWLPWGGGWHHWQLSIWWILAGEFVLVAAICSRWPAAARYMAVSIGLLAAVAFLAIYVNSGFSYAFVAGKRWLELVCDPRVLGVLVGLLPPLCWYYCAPTFADRMKRAAIFLAIGAGLFLACVGIDRGYFHRDFEARVARMIEDHPAQGNWDGLVSSLRKTHGVSSPALTLEMVKSRYPTLDLPQQQARAKALQTAAQARWNSFVAAARVQHTDASPSDLDTLAAKRLAAERLVWQNKWGSKWMPRYIGGVWPALAIAACVLLMRLPTAPLRWIAILFLLSLNLAEATARLYATTEPPFDQVARDVWEGQSEKDGHPADSRTRTYLLHMDFGGMGHPGTMSLFSVNARYYFALNSRTTMAPDQFRSMFGEGDFENVFNIHLERAGSPAQIANMTKRTPKVDRIIVWEGREADDHSKVPNLLPLLGPGWRLSHAEHFIGRMHWMWQETFVCDRLEYVRNVAWAK